MPDGVSLLASPLVYMARRGLFANCRACPERDSCLRRGGLALHWLPVESGDARLRDMGDLASGAQCFLIADHALPERNLHLPAAWLVSGLKHAAGRGRVFRAFMAAGGLEGAVRRVGLDVLERRLIGCGLLTLLRCAPLRH